MDANTSTRQVTYFGARAEVTVNILRGDAKSGLREVLTSWIDDADARNGGHPAGSRTRKVVEGDARKGTLVVIEAEGLVF